MARNGNTLDNGAANLAPDASSKKGKVIELAHTPIPFTVERKLKAFDWNVT